MLPEIDFQFVTPLCFDLIVLIDVEVIRITKLGAGGNIVSTTSARRSVYIAAN